MQRKNNILNKHRNGLAMIMAIIIMVALGTIGALSLKLISQTTKTTTDIYLYEQASIYAKSAAELALLDIAKYGCSNNYDVTFGNSTEIQYDANVTMQYIYTNNSGPAGCNIYTQTTPVTTTEQNGSVMMDITVTLSDENLTTEPIRYFRRTIQKL
ncbi:hypothetical protein [Sulfurimonas marina]|uniref:Type II secretion system protein n=1 Tax=Sulfurimonas marina TaxID=2590551 RepID=A0A7M1AWV7_9BACT|nr:hypothetical protein [Sulfurimonas marina]QOP41941.1 hypothetical protein FJR03_09425 [Sulfurimonas marina]